MAVGVGLMQVHKAGLSSDLQQFAAERQEAVLSWFGLVRGIQWYSMLKKQNVWHRKK